MHVDKNGKLIKTEGIYFLTNQGQDIYNIFYLKFYMTKLKKIKILFTFYFVDIQPSKINKILVSLHELDLLLSLLFTALTRSEK